MTRTLDVPTPRARRERSVLPILRQPVREEARAMLVVSMCEVHGPRAPTPPAASAAGVAE